MNKILQALVQRAEQTPDATAFTGYSERTQQMESISYLSLLVRVREAADQLSRLAAHCIALRAENSLDWVIADLAAMQAQIPSVPVPMFFSDAQVAHTLEQSGADVLIGEWHSWQPELLGQIEGLPLWRNEHAHGAHWLPGSSKITFTSGSTGQPKGVCLSDEQLALVSAALADSIATETCCEKHLILLPLSTLLENITGVYVPLLLGATSVVVPGQAVGLSGSSQFNPNQFAVALSQYQPNSLVLTPALLMALIHIVTLNPMLSRSLKFVAVGGARVTPALLQKAQSLGIPAFEGYGLSECASVVSLNTPSAQKPGTSGRVLPHVEVKIAQDGEVLVRGNVALGYIGEPFAQPWLATGDLGELDEQGFLTINGRKKNQIITAYGRNISPEWLESEAQLLPALQSMVVVGEGQSSLTALVDGNQPEIVVQSIHKLNNTLPDYARIGKVVTVAGLKQQPGLFTSNGRPVRQQFENWLATLPENDNKIVTTQLQQSC
ncbi:AMP-binding protein [Vibrio fluvialis]